jgi:hypothetical protein
MSYRRVTKVTDEASSYDLTTLTNVKQDLGITGTANDPALKRYISAVSGNVANYCNRVFAVETIEDRFLRSSSFTDVTDLLQLSRCPVVEIASVTVDDAPLIAEQDYILNASVGQLIRIDAGGRQCLWHGRTIVVSYDAGFETIPPDLEDAVIRVVTTRYRAKGRDLSIRQESVQGIGERQFWTAANGTASDLGEVLDNYRLEVI